MNQDDTQKALDETNHVLGESVAELLAAPVLPGEEAVNQADPFNELGEEEKDLARLRGMRVDDIVGEYLGVRDNLDEERHKWQKTEHDLKEKLDRMSMVLREKADAIGVDSFPIRGLGTAYRNVKTSYRVGDWQAYWAWLIETGNSQCVEKRAAKLAVQEVHKAIGKVPPGLEHIQEVEFLVRKSKA